MDLVDIFFSHFFQLLAAQYKHLSLVLVTQQSCNECSCDLDPLGVDRTNQTWFPIAVHLV